MSSVGLAREHEFTYIRGHVRPVIYFPENIVHPHCGRVSSHCWAMPMVKCCSPVALGNYTLYCTIGSAFLQSSLSLLTVTVPSFFSNFFRFWLCISFACVFISSSLMGNDSTSSSYSSGTVLGSLIVLTIQCAGKSF